MGSTLRQPAPPVAVPVGRGRRRRAVGLVAALAVLALVVVASIAIGARSISPSTTWQALMDDDGTRDAVIIHTLRIPRTVLGLVAGLAMGLSGALIQALTRNPLADPGLLGINLGAAAGVIVAIGWLGVVTVEGYVWFGLAGAALTSVGVFLLGASGRSASPERLVLAGVAVSAVLGAVIWTVIVTDPRAFDRYRFWDVGSLADRDLSMAWAITPFVLIGAVIALGLARSLNALALGDHSGRALGAHPGRTRTLGVVAVTLMCGAATAAVGPIWFVGLAVPHVARLITGPDHRWVMAYSMLLAPSLLLLADVIGRVVVAPSELEVGIVTAFLGAPVFIGLARRRRVAQL